MRTLKEAFDVYCENRDNYTLYFGDFLDEFYAETTNDSTRLLMVDAEPTNYSRDIERASFLAATAEYLCNLYGIDYPNWTSCEEYFLDEPRFGVNAKGSLRVILLAESPCEFRGRNLFVSGNCLDRA